MIWLYWITGVALGLIWTVPAVFAVLNMKRLADIARPEWLPPEGTVLPSLTIVVPARDEEVALEQALRSLLRLDYPDYHVIALNDRSTDRTGEIMERLIGESHGRLRVVNISALPAGWLGKTHAMWLGARQGSGEWILFTDADCVFHPQSLRRALFYGLRKKLDHVVVLPTAVMATFGERMMMSLVQIFGMLAFRFWKVSDPKARDAVGVGAFNLVRREAYNRIGTHEKIRMEIVDDMKLGEVIKKAGFRQDIVRGADMVSVRWAVGAMGFVRNLGKNLFAFLQFRLIWVAAVCCGFVFLGIWPFLGLLLAPGWARVGFAVAIAMCARTYWTLSGFTGISPLYFLAAPPAAALCAFATARSAFLALRDGGVTWRGTMYSLEELRNKNVTRFGN